MWRDGYYCYAIRHAEQTEHFFGVCFNCRDEGHRWCNCKQPLRPALQEIKDKIGVDGDRLNVFGDDGGKGAAFPTKGPKGTEGQGGTPTAKAQKVKPPKKTPYWNDDPKARWLGPLNLGNAFIDGNWTKVLLDNGLQINSITQAYAKSLDLVVRPLEELAGDPSGHPIQGIRGVRTGVIGYVVFRVQIEGIPSYDKEQVALVVDDSSAFARKVPVILGTLTLHRVVNCMKESEMERAPLEWKNV